MVLSDEAAQELHGQLTAQIQAHHPGHHIRIDPSKTPGKLFVLCVDCDEVNQLAVLVHPEVDPPPLWHCPFCTEVFNAPTRYILYRLVFSHLNIFHFAEPGIGQILTLVEAVIAGSH